MTKEDAIKYLKQLYPNGGHCWLDEQRIEAISMAVNALQEEPVSDIDFEQELYKAFGQVKDFTLCMRIAKRFYDMGKNSQEPVSEELEAEIIRYVGYPQEVDEDISTTMRRNAARHFANWQKQQLMKEAVDGVVQDDFQVKLSDGSYIDLDPSMQRQPAFDVKAGERIKLKMFKEGFDLRNAHGEGEWKPADDDDLPEIDREIIALLDNGKVVFAHRPNPDGWDGNSLTSGKVEHYTPKTYDKGGWNIPNVKYWLDVELPKK